MRFDLENDQETFPLKKKDDFTEVIHNKIMEFDSYGDDFKAKESIKNYFKHNLPDKLRS